MVPRLISIGRGDENSGGMGKVFAPLVCLGTGWNRWGSLSGSSVSDSNGVGKLLDCIPSHVCTVVEIDGSLLWEDVSALDFQ
jgi:hypothetical protein